MTYTEASVLSSDFRSVAFALKIAIAFAAAVLVCADFAQAAGTPANRVLWYDKPAAGQPLKVKAVAGGAVSFPTKAGEVPYRAKRR